MVPEQECMGILVAGAGRGLKQAVLRRARPLGITPPQFWFLNAARELPGASLGELARRQRFDAPTASRLAEGLARRGYLRMHTDARDRRAPPTPLTPPRPRLPHRL